MEQFRNLGLSESMLQTLAAKGFREPTPIQSAVIPYLLDGDRDVVAQAETGTGKTAAFGIPIIERLDTRERGVKALVLVPTRELALQVSEEIISLTGRKNIQVLPVYGGQGFVHQLRSLKKGVDIVVGTPGRLLDHLGRGTLSFEGISFLVLDEADQMLDMGFIEDINAILSHVPAGRRTLLFSATMPASVITIARRYMKGYETITMNARAECPQLTEQKYIEVREQDKFEALCRIIDMEPGFYGLVFCRTRVETADLAEKLVERGYRAEGIHGDINQFEREKIMRSFRERKITILTATDVAARGIDINNLSHVINYALPQDSDAYVHRIGRTGRAGCRGTAITFVTSREHRMLEVIRHKTGNAMRRGHIPGVSEVIAAKRARIREEIEQVMRNDDFGNYCGLAAELLETDDAGTVLAACLRRAFVDELDPATYGEIRQINPVSTLTYTQLFVARGRKHGITPQKLVKLIRQHSGVSENLLRDIRIFDDFSYISAPKAEAEEIRKKFGKKRGRPIISRAKQIRTHSDTKKTRKERVRPAGGKQKQGKSRSSINQERQEKKRSAAW
ncbi:MAG TPA: DEAD/DEAH box helicase [Deltaproteobacteria bacterium]|nr:DEAD/DEAH box helicase [Deltaproteobacteria bacterium]HPR50160.1 DEAD/DEAH box helicase [Deltaproteobacteria bacterium]